MPKRQEAVEVQLSLDFGATEQFIATEVAVEPLVDKQVAQVVDLVAYARERASLTSNTNLVTQRLLREARRINW